MFWTKAQVYKETLKHVHQLSTLLILIRFLSSLSLVLSVKGRTIRKVMGGGGGEGNFRAARIIFRYQILGMNFI